MMTRAAQYERAYAAWVRVYEFLAEHGPMTQAELLTQGPDVPGASRRSVMSLKIKEWRAAGLVVCDGVGGKACRATRCSLPTIEQDRASREREKLSLGAAPVFRPNPQLATARLAPWLKGMYA